MGQAIYYIQKTCLESVTNLKEVVHEQPVEKSLIPVLH